MPRIPPHIRPAYPRIVFTVLMLALALLHGHFGFDNYSMWIGVAAAAPWILPELQQMFSSVKIQGVGEFRFRELSQRLDAVQKQAREGAGGKTRGRTQAENTQAPTGKHLSPGESPDDGEEQSHPEDPDDPNKGMFGGKSEREGYSLQATVTAVPGPDDWFEILAWVDKLKPGDLVEFFLHPTFGSDRMVVPVQATADGRAELKRIAWGAFTMGAKVTTGGRTIPLELNLAELKATPAGFSV